MQNAILLQYLEAEINKAAKTIRERGMNSDELACGKLEFLLALRRYTKGEKRPEDLGLFGAINDVLQYSGVLERDETFLQRLDI